MGKLIINESEKNRILGLYNLNENTTQNVEACPVVTQNSTNIKDLQEIIANIKQKFPKEDPYTKLNSVMNTDKVNFTAQGIPQRIACEISLQLQRTNFAGKNIIIIDTNKNQQLMYIFDSNKKFVAKDYVISGQDAQSKNDEIIKKSLVDYATTMKNNPQFATNDSAFFSYLNKNKTRFLPSGIYVSAGRGFTPKDVGNAGGVNQIYIKPNSGESGALNQALHGFMQSDKVRGLMMNKATGALNLPTDPSVPKEFYDLLNKQDFKSKLSNGCINVPERMVSFLVQYGVDSVILNLSEEEGNYLVSNGKNFLQKSGGESCPSPQSLGAEEFNVA